MDPALATEVSRPGEGEAAVGFRPGPSLTGHFLNNNLENYGAPFYLSRSTIPTTLGRGHS